MLIKSGRFAPKFALNERWGTTGAGARGEKSLRLSILRAHTRPTLVCRDRSDANVTRFARCTLSVCRPGKHRAFNGVRMNICCGFTVEAERERRVWGECGSYQHLGQLLALGSPLRSPPGETLGTRIRIWSSDTEQIALERVFSLSVRIFFPFLFLFFSKEDQNDSW